MFSACLKYLLAAVVILIGSPHALCGPGMAVDRHEKGVAVPLASGCSHCRGGRADSRAPSPAPDDEDCPHCQIRSLPAISSSLVAVVEKSVPLKIDLPPVLAAPHAALPSLAAAPNPFQPHSTVPLPRLGCALCLVLRHLLF